MSGFSEKVSTSAFGPWILALPELVIKEIILRTEVPLWPALAASRPLLDRLVREILGHQYQEIWELLVFSERGHVPNEMLKKFCFCQFTNFAEELRRRLLEAGNRKGAMWIYMRYNSLDLVYGLNYVRYNCLVNEKEPDLPCDLRSDARVVRKFFKEFKKTREDMNNKPHSKGKKKLTV